MILQFNAGFKVEILHHILASCRLLSPLTLCQSALFNNPSYWFYRSALKGVSRAAGSIRAHKHTHSQCAEISWPNRNKLVLCLSGCGLLPSDLCVLHVVCTFFCCASLVLLVKICFQLYICCFSCVKMQLLGHFLKFNLVVVLFAVII